MSLSVKRQYQRFPYPPVNALALPRRDQGQALAWARGAEWARQQGLNLSSDGRGLRILVAGCGTVEALVVAQMHPQASEVVALDLSEASLQRLGRRLTLARMRDVCSLAALRGRSLPRVQRVAADMHHWHGGEFDYIVASNVLHHTPDAALALRRLASMLKPGGLMRVVTYPAHSRLWIRHVGVWLRWFGLHHDTPRLQWSAASLMRELPDAHPLKTCFFAHSEHRTEAGLVDAFLHALERPLRPWQWRIAIAAAGLKSLAEDQHELSRSSVLSELVPATSVLDDWQRLQVMDDLLELATNPVWWLYKGQAEDEEALPVLPSIKVPVAHGDSRMLCASMSPQQLAGSEWMAQTWQLPSQAYFELGQGVRRAAALLQQVDVDVEQVLQAFKHEYGQRVDQHGRDLPGLALCDYSAAELLASVRPWSAALWQQLQQQLPPTAHLKYAGAVVPGDGLVAQASYLQLRYGALQSSIEIEFGV